MAERERGIALSLANRSAELPLLERAVKHKILVSAQPNRRITRRENGFVWEIDVKEFKTKFLNSLVVLAENSIDAELYQEAARHHQVSKQIKGVVPRSSARGGGGSQIYVELKALLTEGIPVFAITDGDFLYPGMGPSVASSRCADLVAEQSGVGWHYGLPAREVENIIPVQVLLDVADPANARNAFDSTQQLAEITKDTETCPCNFSCFKKGITLSEIFGSSNEHERAYWVSVAGAIKHLRSKTFQTCVDKGSCEMKECACFLNYGFGENVLKQVKKWVVEKSPHESLQRFGASEVWMNVGEMVFDASIAFKPANI